MTATVLQPNQLSERFFSCNKTNFLGHNFLYLFFNYKSLRHPRSSRHNRKRKTIDQISKGSSSVLPTTVRLPGVKISNETFSINKSFARSCVKKKHKWWQTHLFEYIIDVTRTKKKIKVMEN